MKAESKDFQHDFTVKVLLLPPFLPFPIKYMWPLANHVVQTHCEVSGNVSPSQDSSGRWEENGKHGEERLLLSEVRAQVL